MSDRPPGGLLAAMLATLRKTLHEVPELSDHETTTALAVHQFLSLYKPDVLMTGLGGCGVAAVFDGAAPGPTVLVRAELDALPVEDADSPDAFNGAAHRCGHDGHMSIVAGLAPRIRAQGLARGRVVLLFQPAEETGEGAARVIADPHFSDIRPDFALALHNLPGVETNQVVFRRGVFSSASAGMEIELLGEPSHAAEPHKANSPMRALTELMDPVQGLQSLGDPRSDTGKLSSVGNPEDRAMITITHVRLGQPSFGITPGHATMYATCRATTSVRLDALRARAEQLVGAIAARESLGLQLRWRDVFPETSNNDGLVENLTAVCEEAGIAVAHAPAPYDWSDDFGHFSRVCPSLYFGLGSGRDSPRLHQQGYHFEDECIPVGLAVFEALVRRLTEPFQPRVRRAGETSAVGATGR